jgi:DNA (cytosine-5)-methyltransferase 1
MRIIDLFAGIGGIRKGFELAGQTQGEAVDCVFTSEWDKFACQTYSANYQGEKIAGDITEVSELNIPPHDVLLAGFPCQPFSQAGLKKGFNDTRGTLFFDIERILRHHMPPVFLLENVKQLKGHDKENPKDKIGRTFRVILEVLDGIGYKVSWQVLKARDFGVPQNRERIYIVGFLDHNIDFTFPAPLNQETRVRDILQRRVDPKYTISDRLWEGHQRRKIENRRNGKGFGYGLFSADAKYTNTLSARYYKDGSEILISQRGRNPRKLTPRECARLQGYPEEFILPQEVSDNQFYRQFGNSVAVPVIEAIANSIIDAQRELTHRPEIIEVQ